ncbi:hypothetical protein ACHAWF_011288 [Thalassiosira exigua]
MASTYLAKKAAGKKADSFLKPLLSDDESSTGSDDGSDVDSSASSEVETVKQTPMQKLKSLVVYVGLGGGVAACAAAMVLTPAIPIFVMGGICIANAPYSAIKERQILKTPSLRGMNNKLREDANNLGDEVDNLAEEIVKFNYNSERAAKCEEQLRGIVGEQQANVNKLVELVKENEIILSKMRDNLRQRIVQDMITIVVKSDKDNDQQIDRSEAKTLALRIRLSLQEYGVVFDSEKFLKAIGENATVQGVIAIVQKLLPSEKPKKETHDGDSDSDSDFDSDSDSDDDSVFDMFYMADGPEGGDGDHGLSLMKCDKHKKSHR